MGTDPGRVAVDQYLAQVPAKFRPALARLRSTIRAAAPRAEELISYRLPAFRQDGVLVYYAAFRDHLSFFVGSSTVRRQFEHELAAFAAGKGTLHFTPDHPLPARLVTQIVRARVRENALRRAARATRTGARRPQNGRAASRDPREATPDSSRHRFARLAKELADGDATDAHRPGFGTGSLFVGRKMFGLLNESGGLVLKLPAGRVAELISTGVGTGWHPGSGAPLKEYVALGPEEHGRWLVLAKESRAYMAGKR